MARKRFRDFPVLGNQGKFVGLVSRRRLLNVKKKQVILVDHNEKNQAVDGVEEADVLEIIDHHRLSSIETMGPVYFRNRWDVRLRSYIRCMKKMGLRWMQSMRHSSVQQSFLIP